MCLQESSDPESSDQSRTERWNTLDMVKGTFGPDDCAQDLLEVKFERPLPIKVTGYVIDLCMHWSVLDIYIF